jgi:hypothetical protein
MIKNDGSNPELIQPRRTTARNDRDRFFKSPLKLIGKGILNQSAENNANTKVKKQESLNNCNAKNGEKHISSETEPLKLCIKRKFSEVEGASDVKEPVGKRPRLSSYTPLTK